MLGNIFKTAVDHQTVTYVALVPDVKDLNGDIISKDEVIKTAHEFMVNIQDKYVNEDHVKGSNKPDTAYAFVESYILPVSIKNDSGKTIPAGSRLVAIKFFDQDLRDAVKKGDYVGISIEGVGVSIKID